MRFMNPTDLQIAEWTEWVTTRPPRVREMALRFDPWTLYRMNSTGRRVTILAISEPDEDTNQITLRVLISGKFNFVSFERQVFGIDPDDLEECDLPAPGEALGNTNLKPEDMRTLLGMRGDAS